MVALFSPILGFLCQEGVVEYAPPFNKAGLSGPYYVGEKALKSPGQRFGQDFVKASEEGDWAPVSDLAVIPRFGDQGYEPLVHPF